MPAFQIPLHLRPWLSAEATHDDRAHHPAPVRRGALTALCGEPLTRDGVSPSSPSCEACATALEGMHSAVLPALAAAVLSRHPGASAVRSLTIQVGTHRWGVYSAEGALISEGRTLTEAAAIAAGWGGVAGM